MSDTGYGTVTIARHTKLAHRVAYETAKGPIPAGYHVHHECNNRACVNPEHLTAMTAKENKLLGTSPNAANARKSHCVNGHEFTPENTYHRRDQPLRRTCRRCNNDRKKALNARYRAAGIRPNVWKVRRDRIKQRDGYRCHWCAGDAWTVDHLVPLIEGGSNADSNLVAACLPCNSKHAGRERSWVAA